MQTECIPDLFGFEPVEGRSVVAAFDGGSITSDAGALLLGATDRAIGLIDRFAACFRDAVAVFGGGERIVADPPVDLRERALLRGRTRRY